MTQIQANALMFFIDKPTIDKSFYFNFYFTVTLKFTAFRISRKVN